LTLRDGDLQNVIVHCGISNVAHSHRSRSETIERSQIAIDPATYLTTHNRNLGLAAITASYRHNSGDPNF